MSSKAKTKAPKKAAVPTGGAAPAAETASKKDKKEKKKEKVPEPVEAEAADSGDEEAPKAAPAKEKKEKKKEKKEEKKKEKGSKKKGSSKGEGKEEKEKAKKPTMKEKIAARLEEPEFVEFEAKIKEMLEVERDPLTSIMPTALARVQAALAQWKLELGNFAAAGKGKKRKAEGEKRASSGYNRFLKWYSPIVASDPTSDGSRDKRMTMVGAAWRALSESEKQEWVDRAKANGKDPAYPAGVKITPAGSKRATKKAKVTPEPEAEAEDSD